MEAQIDTLHLLSHPKKAQQQFKNKKQPELTENWTVWKPDNQGDKEETFIQTGRSEGDGQLEWRGLDCQVAAGRLGGPTFSCG